MFLHFVVRSCQAKEGPLLDASRRGLDEDEAAQQEALSLAGEVGS